MGENLFRVGVVKRKPLPNPEEHLQEVVIGNDGVYLMPIKSLVRSFRCQRSV